MDQDIATGQLRKAMDTTRREIEGTVEELKERVGEAVDWRSYVQRYPLASLGVALAAGLLIGRRIGGVVLEMSSRGNGAESSFSWSPPRQFGDSWARAGSRLESIVNRVIDEAGDKVEQFLVPSLIGGFARLVGGPHAGPAGDQYAGPGEVRRDARAGMSDPREGVGMDRERRATA